ncbi:carboxymuconolactone decarboxylase family protein [Achromobacter denitrificans]|jgi:AhpD family alkylhydroperoxidase|uniref:Carboxymuconolactone decarboxylase family protein n=1 Tax=Achromobacter denitrificans TaxID=32002 RepID=A0A3R9FWH8_ACHDE|nr:MULTISPECIES: carboxymuconolactone decarboxylase family protein [Achromobacter]MBV2158494.1 carboxymuconolactone decarboxylase family protein [Achromobacter denitrificans]MDF3851898.1 carboxymuconolactone decarboxylase family protein [Achromobacter denitrificans]MDF3860991.1 carboxymuconolactone decarboxylase family protein [Achromobacter denitrificans]MDF3941570.1 carboxymuconolactone decarboxylase family protein [Achromobacter denitrificans]MDX3878345.1 carboxymuconolactone decarboxylase 
MTQRLNYFETSAELTKKYLEFSTAVKKTAMAREFGHLVDIRASQINGCAFCVDMHVKQAKIHGERELRLHHLVIWRESTLFSPRERAVLAWTEAVTTLGPEGVPDAVFQSLREQFSEAEISDLTLMVIAINGWNRLSVSFRNVPGSADAAYGLDKAGLK